MNKAIALLLIGLFVASTVAATSQLLPEEDVYPCGPNDIDCYPVQLDVVFVVDSTGSMHDEIRTVKEELTNIINRINSGYPRPDVNVGIVTYRDYEPEEHEYLTMERQLTSNTWSAINFVRNIEARGGGDYEEAVEAGLNKAINDMNWRSNARKIIILVGDAPARDYPQYQGDQYGNEPDQPFQYNWKDAIEDANDKGIRIYTASGSGMNERGMDQWRTIAAKTGGSYINLLYQRKNVVRHYEDNEIPMEFIAEARAAPDYDESTDSVMTNDLGVFATGAIQKEAEEAGVEYNSLEDITGEIINPKPNSFKGFLEKIFQTLIFWN